MTVGFLPAWKQPVATLTASSLEERFGTTRTITELPLEIGDGECVGLPGPSGCGK